MLSSCRKEFTKFVLENVDIFLDKEGGITSDIYSAEKFDTADSAAKFKSILLDSADLSNSSNLKEFKAVPYVITYSKAEFSKLPDLHAITSKARSINQDDFDKLLLVELSKIRSILVCKATLGMSVHVHTLELPYTPTDVKYTWCESSQVLKEFLAECKEISMSITVDIPNKSQIKFKFEW